MKCASCGGEMIDPETIQGRRARAGAKRRKHCCYQCFLDHYRQRKGDRVKHNVADHPIHLSHCLLEENMSKIVQSDIRHECRARMWHCTNCGEDFCMAEEPKFCPMCGILPQSVKAAPEDSFAPMREES